MIFANVYVCVFALQHVCACVCLSIFYTWYHVISEQVFFSLSTSWSFISCDLLSMHTLALLSVLYFFVLELEHRTLHMTAKHCATAPCYAFPGLFLILGAKQCFWHWTQGNLWLLHRCTPPVEVVPFYFLFLESFSLLCAVTEGAGSCGCLSCDTEMIMQLLPLRYWYDALCEIIWNMASTWHPEDKSHLITVHVYHSMISYSGLFVLFVGGVDL